MDIKEKNNSQSYGNFIVRKTGNSLSLTIPKKANIAEGTEFQLSINSAGQLVFTPEKKHVNIWHTDKAKNHDFEADKKIVGTPDDFGKVGREL